MSTAPSTTNTSAARASEDSSSLTDRFVVLRNSNSAPERHARIGSPARVLDLHDVGTRVGEQFRAVGARDLAC